MDLHEKLHESFPGRFLRCTDLLADTVVTIAGVDRQKVSPSTWHETMVMAFTDFPKPLPLSEPTLLRIAGLFGGGNDITKWIGKTIVLIPAGIDIEFRLPR